MRIANSLMLLILIALVGCKTETTKTEVKVPKPNTSKGEEILENLKKPKEGFTCDLEELDSGKVTSIFYLDRSMSYSDGVLYHKFYSINDDGKSATPYIVINSRKLWLAPYKSVVDEIYTSKNFTLRVDGNVTEDDGVFGVDANIYFDSKVNEFTIDLVAKSLNEDGTMELKELSQAKITNCIESEMTIQVGLD